MNDPEPRIWTIRELARDAAVGVETALRGSNSPRTCARVSAKAVAKIEQIGAKVRDLVAMKAILTGLASACPEDGVGASCPILDVLDRDE